MRTSLGVVLALLALIAFAAPIVNALRMSNLVTAHAQPVDVSYLRMFKIRQQGGRQSADLPMARLRVMVERLFSDERGEITIDVEKTATDELKSLRAAALAKGNAILEALGDDGVPDKDQRKVLREAAADVTALDTALAEREGDAEAIARLRAGKDAVEQAHQRARDNARTELYGRESGLSVVEFKTPGEQFVESEAYEQFGKRGYAGDSDAHAVDGLRQMLGLFTATERMTGRGMRSLVTAADTVAGDLVRPDFRGLLEPGLVRPLTLRDLVTVIPTSSDAIEYVKETSRLANAAAVPEAVQVDHTGDTTATKPEGGLVFDIVTDTIKTIAEWVPATKRILSDAPQLRGYIDQYLRDDLAIELEDQIMAGAGGNGFTGILNVAGTQTLANMGAGTSLLDQIRRAKRLVRVNARTNATAIVLNPEDNENLDRLKVNSEVNHFVVNPYTGSESSPVWGLPRVENESVPAGTVVVGDFRRAVLYDREQTTISVGTADKDFIRNIVRVLAELRAGFGVLRPAAFVKITI